ncbi:MAG: hypothetical protein JKY52_12640 [Flavobacteriales bacterium]|nr:hypothetical protein [Flavobacteriales bacterium]
MSTRLRFVCCLLLLSISNVEQGNAFNLLSADSLENQAQPADTTLPLVHLDYASLKGLPLRSLESLVLTLPAAYSDRGVLHIHNSDLTASNFIVDGMQIRYAGAFPYRAIRQIHDYSMVAPIDLGFALNLIGIGTERNIDKWHLSVETASDFRFYKMKSDYPLESKRGPTYFYPYGNDLIAFDLAGPLKVGKRTGSLLAAINLSKRHEQNPSTINNFQIKQSTLKSLQDDPLRVSDFGLGSRENAEFVSINDIEQTRHSRNAGIKGINSYIRVELPFTDKVKLALGSYINVSKARQFIYENALFNAENNPEVITRNFDNYAQLSHTLKEKGSTKLSYVAQMTYSSYYKKVQSPVHKDALFKYGYLGKFTTYKATSYSFGTDAISGVTGLIQDGWVDTLYTFQPGGFNVNTENYTSDYYSLYSDPVGNYENRNQVIVGGGLVNGYTGGSLSGDVYGIWNSTGHVNDLFSIKNEEVLRGKAMLELIHGQHAFHIGFEATRQMERSYAVNPIGLWRQMILLTNNHILQLDKLNPELQMIFDPVADTATFGGFVNYPRSYDGAGQANFDKKLREKLGLVVDDTEWIDLNSLPLETFSLDMFSADELLNNGSRLVNYYGYDHLGNKLSENNAALDFYDQVGPDGNLTRNVGAYAPRAWAGYMDYAFTHERFEATLGLRFDYFNAEQPVLKDKYSLYEIRTVANVAGTLNSAGSHPSGMGPDYAVYVNNIDNPTQILGYRNGDQWYNEDGAAIPNGMPLQTSSGVLPYLKDPNASLANAFENYQAIVNILPQFSIRFNSPWSWSIFASHYAATENPRIFNVFRPGDYLYIQNTSAVINNSALQPLRSSKLKIGVGQKLTNKFYGELYYARTNFEAITLSAITDAYPVRYTTYGITSMKGDAFIVSTRYKHPQSTGLNGSLNFAAQFNQGFIRQVISGYFQFNFGNKTNYRGFTIGNGKQPLRDFGVGLFFHFREGAKYSRIRGAIQEGAIYASGQGILDGSPNGSQLPPTSFLHLKVERSIALPSINAQLDIYFVVQNLFNRKNLNDVYPYTGDPSDDGYLTNPGSQAGIDSANDPEAYRALYALKVDDPRNYGAPRVIRLGAVFNF